MTHADEPTLRVFQSVDLLNNQLQLIDIIANPDRIQYGRKRLTSVFKFFHKHARLFEERAINKQIRIKLHGQSYGQFHSFESFNFLPLILLDNAIKYSLEDKDIHLTINDKEGSSEVEVIVSSFGPIVKPENHKKIFDKYFRDDNARYFSNQGQGIGLFLAQQVALAHGFTISYNCLFPETVRNMTIGRNEFSFRIPIESYDTE